MQAFITLFLQEPFGGLCIKEIYYKHKEKLYSGHVRFLNEMIIIKDLFK